MLLYSCHSLVDSFPLCRAGEIPRINAADGVKQIFWCPNVGGPPGDISCVSSARPNIVRIPRRRGASYVVALDRLGSRLCLSALEPSV